MSYWTYIIGTIEIDLMDSFFYEICNSDEAKVTQEDIDKRAKDIVDHMPKITGSEVNAEVFLNRGDWVGWSVPEKLDPNDLKYRDYRFKFFITIWGALRDRFKKDTEAEVKKVMEYLREKVDINHEPGDESSVCDVLRIVGDDPDEGDRKNL